MYSQRHSKDVMIECQLRSQLQRLIYRFYVKSRSMKYSQGKVTISEWSNIQPISDTCHAHAHEMKRSEVELEDMNRNEICAFKVFML